MSLCLIHSSCSCNTLSIRKVNIGTKIIHEPVHVSSQGQKLKRTFKPRFYENTFFSMKHVFRGGDCACTLKSPKSDRHDPLFNFLKPIRWRRRKSWRLFFWKGTEIDRNKMQNTHKHAQAHSPLHANNLKYITRTPAPAHMLSISLSRWFFEHFRCFLVCGAVQPSWPPLRTLSLQQRLPGCHDWQARWWAVSVMIFFAKWVLFFCSQIFVWGMLQSGQSKTCALSSFVCFFVRRVSKSSSDSSQSSAVVKILFCSCFLLFFFFFSFLSFQFFFLYVWCFIVLSKGKKSQRQQRQTTEIVKHTRSIN